MEYGGYSCTEQIYKYFTKYEYGNEGGLRYTIMDPDYYQELKQDVYMILDINKTCSIRNLIDFCKKDNNSWTKKQYDLVNHNCQNFASLVLKCLKCTRKEWKDKRGLHAFSKVKIPMACIKPIRNK